MAASARLCYLFLPTTHARVAQWIRAFASGAKGRRFDPCRGYQFLLNDSARFKSLKINTRCLRLHYRPPGFNALSKAEQVVSVQALWDRNSEDPGALPVPASHLRLAEDRLNAIAKILHARIQRSKYSTVLLPVPTQSEALCGLLSM